MQKKTMGNTRTNLGHQFQTIVNGLRNLERSYKNVDHITKILRCLPKKWRSKVKAIQDAKDLNALKMEDLMGSLKVHELVLAQDDGSKKQKFVALKAIGSKDLKVEESSDELNALTDDSDDEQAFINRKFRRMQKK